MWRTPLALAILAALSLPAHSALDDLDNDGIADAQDPDRDGDGLPNFLEAAAGFDPDVPDQTDIDGDGIWHGGGQGDGDGDNGANCGSD